MKNLKLISIILILLSTQVFARSMGRYSKGSLSVEPVLGYEKVQSILPTPHTSNRLFYGIRANWGPELLSLEAEATQSKDDSTHENGTVEVSQTSKNYTLGLRSSYGLGRNFKWYLRAGGSARDSKYTKTEAGVTTTQEPATYISPYAGSGLTLNMFGFFSLNAGITAVFTDHKNVSEPEYQSSLGFSVKI